MSNFSESRPLPQNDVFSTYALEYTAKNIPVFPCKSKTKAPAPTGWTKWCDELPSKAQIEEWCKTFPNSNLAIATGPASGIIAFDWDLDPEISAIQKDLFEEVKELFNKIKSPVARTGKKGICYFFKFEGEKSYRCRIRKTKNDTITVFDLLSSKHCVVIPPSIHPEGMEYKWNGTPLLEFKGELPPLPTDIIEQIYDKIREWIKRNNGWELEGTGKDLKPSHYPNLAPWKENPVEGWEELAEDFCLLYNLSISKRLADRFLIDIDTKSIHASNVNFATIYSSGYYFHPLDGYFRIFSERGIDPTEYVQTEEWTQKEKKLNCGKFSNLSTLEDVKSIARTDSYQEHSFQELGKVSKIASLKDIAKCGFSIEFLAHKFIEMKERGDNNFSNLGKLLGATQLMVSTKKPVISDTCDSGKWWECVGLYKNKSSVISATPGWGKSVIIRTELVKYALETGKAMLILSERVEDTLSNELAIHMQQIIENGKSVVKERFEDEGDSYYQDLDNYKKEGEHKERNEDQENKLELLDKYLVDTSIYGDVSRAKEINGGLPRDYIRRECENMINSLDVTYVLENMIFPFFPPSIDETLVGSTFSYNPSLCLLENGSISKCNRNCIKTSCRAHPYNKTVINKYRILCAAHKAFHYNSRKLLKLDSIEVPKAEKRQLIVFDEKPEVFKVYELAYSDNPHGNLSNFLKRELGASGGLDDDAKSTCEKIETWFIGKIKDAKKSTRDNETWVMLGKGQVINSKEYKALKEALCNKRSSPEQVEDTDAYFGRLSLIDSIRILTEEKVIHRFERKNDGTSTLTVCWGDNLWNRYNPQKENTQYLIFDGTADLDVDYSMANALPVVKVDEGKTYPNLTFWSYHFKEKSKTKFEKEYGYVIDLVKSIAKKYSKILIVTSKDEGIKKDIKEKLAEFGDKILINHQGNLKGRNAYKECDCVVFGHVFRLGELDYLARAKELMDLSSILPGKWVPVKSPAKAEGSATAKSKNSLFEIVPGSPALSFRDERLETLRIQIDLAETIQTIYRTKLREDSNHTVSVYIPTGNSPLLGNLLNYFKGAKLENISEN